ncbi:MAG: cytochrome c biogenesis protein ResB [Bacteroidetes bacterium]|nr:cytochrome c biogenesis protein ResB [Bacteroidota bacterium]
MATAEPAAEQNEGGAIDALWSLLSSLRLALVLILLLAAATLAGTLLVQAPPYVVQNPAVFPQWLETLRPKYGIFTSVFGMLGLFNVFSSPLFATLLGVLGLNVIICTLDRWPRLWRTYAHPPVEVSEGYFDQAKLSADLTASSTDLQAAASQVESALRSHGYRVRSSQAEDSVSLYADRFAWSRFGTFFNHAGLVLVLLGAVMGGMLGFRDNSFVLPEGTTMPVGHGTDLALYLDSFAEESYPTGQPKDYWSEVILFNGDTEVARKTIRVNDPLVYKLDPLGFNEVRFHQSFFGNAIDLEIEDESGNAIYNGSVPLAYTSDSFGGRPLGELDLYHQGFIVQVIGRIAGQVDPVVEPGETLVLIYNSNTGKAVDMGKLTMREPKKLGGLNITFKRERQFSGFQVVSDPGTRVVWLACAFIVLGIISVFYFPARRLRVRCVREGNRMRIRMGGSTERYVSYEEEFRKLTNAVQSKLGARAAAPSTVAGGPAGRKGG